MALNGPLQEFPLTDIISLVELGKQTGAAQINTVMEGEPVTGRIYFKGGNVVHAELEEMPAEEALFTMFSLLEGNFEFHNGEPPPREDIKRNNAFLIMMGINHGDEIKKLNEIVPDLSIIPVLADNLNGDQVNLTPDEWKILTTVNGNDDLESISKITRLGKFRSRKAFAHLLEMGVLGTLERNLNLEVYMELEAVATSQLGNSARNLLDQSYQRAHLNPESDITFAQGLEVVETFRKLAAMLVGPGKAKAMADHMNERVHFVFGLN